MYIINKDLALGETDNFGLKVQMRLRVDVNSFGQLGESNGFGALGCYRTVGSFAVLLLSNFK